MRCLLLSLSVVLAACGGHALSPPSSTPRGLGSEDEATSLARELPGGARQCVVARPARLDQQARRGARWVSRAYPFAWLADLDVRAYASAMQITEPNGERNDVILLEVRGDATHVKAVLAAQPWLRIAWEGEAPACEDLDCLRAVARGTIARADDGESWLVRIRRGTWRAARRTPVDGRCAGLLRNEPGTLEASAFYRPYEALGIAHWERRAVSVERSGLRTVARIELADALAGLSLLASLQGGYDGPARIVSQSMEGTNVVRVAEASWDDLALAVGDEERLARAVAHEATLEAPRAIGDIDVADRNVLLAQASARRAALASRSGAARSDAARELVVLLSAGHDASPDDAAIGIALVRAQLDELHDGAAAVRVAREMHARDPDDDALAALEREALAVSGDVSALAAALVRDGVLSDVRGGRGAGSHDRRAARVAADVIAAQRDGARYAWAEGGVRAGALLDETPAQPVVAVDHPARLPLAGVPAALLALLRLGAADRWAPRAVYVRAAGDDVQLPPHVPADDAAPAPPLLLRDAAGHATLLLAGRSDDSALTLARAGRDLAAGSGSGALTITMSLVPFDRELPARPETSVVIAGRVADGVLEVARASRNGARLDWDVIARVLATPLASIPLRLYPPADVPIDARDVAEAERLADRAAPDVSCARDEAHLSCRAVAGSSDDLARTLTDLAGVLLGATPQALFPRLPAAPPAVQRSR